MQYNIYEYKILPFGLINKLLIVWIYINNISRDLLNSFHNGYINNNSIVLNKIQECKIYIKKILAHLEAASLQADLNKCEFYIKKTKFLGFIISTTEFLVNPWTITIIKYL